MPIVSSGSTPSVPQTPIHSPAPPLPGIPHGHYQYLTVPFLGSIQHGVFNSQGSDVVSHQLQDAINHHVAQGWEYCHVATVYVAINPGCIASLLGREISMRQMNQIIFRRFI